ncbi:MAG: GTP 3',8-cyclase MoaA [Aquificota bacterium]|nr:GTP 3',8-cyclase MoaA [Aquificota bacterium]
MLKDRLGRPLKDIRISVTDRCNFRCFFCMPKDRKIEFLPRREILSFEEIARVVRIARGLGVRKVRITGGEPLIRSRIEELIRMLRDTGVEDVALTTNGYLLLEKAESLKKAGLKRITVSLPTLREERFRYVAGRDVSLRKVIEGIEEARSVGLEPVKVNTVVVRGFNEDEMPEIAEFCRERGLVLRFIEFMDVGTLNGWSLDKVFPAEEILMALRTRYDLEEVGREDPSETSINFRYRDLDLTVGIIASVTMPFCGNCSRLRISADGKVFTCLFASEGFDLKGLIRGGATDEEIADFLMRVWGSREDRYSEIEVGAYNPQD